MAESKKTLFSAVKNEGPFLVEWIAYHKSMGFDKILIVSNDSDDGTTELLDALHAAGEIHHIHHSVGPDESPQGRAAAAANGSGIIQDGDWVIWLDADEFLNIHGGQGRVEDLIYSLGPASGMLIPWRIFGDGGNATFPGRFVSESFTRAAERDFQGNQSIKTLYRHSEGRTQLPSVSPHRPHLMIAKSYKASEFLNAAGRPLVKEFGRTKRWLKGIQGRGNFAVPAEDYAWDLAQINHYSVRTRDMFDLKAHRGRGFSRAAEGKPVRPRHTPKFFHEHNRNEAEDRSILRHEAATTAGIARLLALGAVRQAHDRACGLTDERLAALHAAQEASDDASDRDQMS